MAKRTTRTVRARVMKKGDDVERSTLLTGDDVFLFNEGTHHRLYEKLGSHLVSVDGVDGAYFAVWAPNAERVAVVGEFNDWNPDATPLTSEGVSGIWEAFVPHVGHGAIYKYQIWSRLHGQVVQKADPFAIHAETSPKTRSVACQLECPGPL